MFLLDRNHLLTLAAKHVQRLWSRRPKYNTPIVQPACTKSVKDTPGGDCGLPAPVDVANKAPIITSITFQNLYQPGPTSRSTRSISFGCSSQQGPGKQTVDSYLNPLICLRYVLVIYNNWNCCNPWKVSGPITRESWPCWCWCYPQGHQDPNMWAFCTLNHLASDS